MKCCNSTIGPPCAHRTIIETGARVWWLDLEQGLAHVGTVVEQLPDRAPTADRLVHVVRIASNRGQYVVDLRTTAVHVINSSHAIAPIGERS